MSEERIDIVVTDKVAAGIASKMNNIADAAEKADKSVKSFSSSLSKLPTKQVSTLATALVTAASAFGSLNTSVSAATKTLATAQIQSAKVATAQQQLAAATARTASALSQAAAASTRAATASAQLAAAEARTARAQSDAASAAARLEAATARAASAKAKAAADATRYSAAVEKASTATRKLGDGASSLRGALAGLTAALSVRELARTADGYTEISARLGISAENQDDLNKRMKESFSIAQAARMNWAGVASIYSTVSDSAKELRLDQEGVATFTKQIAFAMASVPTSADSANAALRQFQQALLSGRLRGEEFNSVSEQAPGLMRALRLGLNVTTGELRAMAEAGQLTTDVLQRGLARAFPIIEAQMKKLPLTIGQSLTLLSNQFTMYIGEADKANGATMAISSAIVALGNNLNIIIPAVATLGVMWATVQVASIVTGFISLASAIYGAAAATTTFTAALIANPIGLIVAGVAALIGGIIYFRNELGLTDANIKAFVNWTVDGFKRMIEGAEAAGRYIRSIFDNLATSITNAWDTAMNAVKGFFSAVEGWISGMISKIQAAIQALSTFLSMGGGSDSTTTEARAMGGPTSARTPYLTGERGPELYRSNDGKSSRMLGMNGPEFFSPPKDGYVYNAADTARMIGRATGGPVSKDGVPLGKTTDTMTGKQYRFSPADNVPDGFSDVMGSSGYYPVRNPSTYSLRLEQLPPYFLPKTVEDLKFQYNEATSFARALNGDASSVMKKIAEEYAVTKVFGSPERYAQAVGYAAADGLGGILYNIMLSKSGSTYTKSGDEPVWSLPYTTHPRDIVTLDKSDKEVQRQLSQVVSAFEGVDRKKGEVYGEDIPRFRDGGSFVVGGRAGGDDPNLVQFRANKGETVDVRKRGQSPGGGDSYSGSVTIINNGVKDAGDAYGRNKGQIERSNMRALERAKKRR